MIEEAIKKGKLPSFTWPGGYPLEPAYEE